MIFRSLSIAAIAVLLDLSFAQAASVEALASSGITASVEADLPAYRAYVKAQADTLVGMTRVLAGEIRNGNLEAAQMAYAPAHRYYTRIAQIARAFPDLTTRIDARADAFEKKEADPTFSGFHRIEYGLFANRSTHDLSDAADRLDEDARDLRARLASLDVTPAALIDGVVGTLRETVDASLAGGEERYAKTDLWDLEANVEGARQVLAILPPVQTSRVRAAAAPRFAEIDTLLEKHKAGCGFQNSDALSEDDRAAMTASVAALATAFATLRGPAVTD